MASETDKKPPTEARASIIEAVKTPLGLFALIVLMIEAVIGLLAARAPASSIPYIIGGMIAILALVILVVGGIYWPRSGGGGDVKKPIEEPIKYDVFVSAPMAAFTTKEEFIKHNTAVLKVIESLRVKCSVQSVFYAGQAIKSPDDFELTDASLDVDLLALKQSGVYLMIYPEKKVSSVLVEAGMALALGKKAIFLVHDDKDLPFMLQGAGMAKSVDAHVYEFKDYDELRNTRIKQVWDTIKK